jgi:hypothetical protein
MEGVLHGSKVKDFFYVPGECGTSADDGQLGPYHRAIVDEALEGSR